MWLIIKLTVILQSKEKIQKTGKLVPKNFNEIHGYDIIYILRLFTHTSFSCINKLFELLEMPKKMLTYKCFLKKMFFMLTKLCRNPNVYTVRYLLKTVVVFFFHLHCSVLCFYYKFTKAMNSKPKHYPWKSVFKKLTPFVFCTWNLFCK